MPVYGIWQVKNVMEFDKDTSTLQRMGTIIIYIMWIGG